MTTLTRSNKALIFDFCWVVATLAVFLFVAEWRRSNPGPSLLISHDMSETLGAEYNAIAIAIVKGRGFSDPFMVESGPTAWMPPILPYIIAVLYYLFSGDKSYVIFFLHTFQSISIYFAGFVFIRISRLFRPFGLGHVILPIGLLTEFQGLFQRLDDTWLILFVYNLVLLNAVGMARGRKQSYLWIRSGCLIGFTTLCSPIAGVVGFISFSIGLLIRYSVVMKGKRRNIRWILGH